MGWERQKSSVAAMPEEPSMVLWLIGGLVALISGVLLFFLHANQLLGVWQHYNLWVLSGAPLFVWFVLICLRGWLYNNTMDKHEFEAKEADYSQQQWTEWAGRYLAVLDSWILLAEGVTPKAILLASPELPQHNKQACRVDEKYRQALSLLLEGGISALQELPPDLPLNVFLLTDSPEDYADLQDIFESYWRYLMPAERQAPTLEILHSYSFDAVERRIKSPELSAELILVQQMHGGEHYSDALACLLLTSDDVAAKYELNHDARLLRPMRLDSDNLLNELDIYFSTQIQANSTQYIIGDSVRWGGSFSSILEAAARYKGRWKTEQLHLLETYAGMSGPFSPWIMAAVVSDVVRLQRKDCLMLSESEGQYFINTVTAGNKHENS
ncbi:hypothetical protein ACI2JI_12665 [Enterobacter cancerogenus]|uniref:hypothetical protein n=1 Tax=Enterobacter cancerogenus TaxID=69218 RepID=UPI00384D7F7C